jgi:DNA repair protein RecN (Recombination protein N)
MENVISTDGAIRGRGTLMLRGLDIRDLLIIDHLELEFQPGLNVLTGETGAGKSILLDALGFVLGWRGRAELVRTGAAQGEVTASFDLGPDHPARAVLSEAGLPVSDELILRRVNTAEGRKTAWINDRRASGEVLRQISDTLVELHGQQDDRGLLNPRAHRDLLDTFADSAPLLEQLRTSWKELRRAQKDLQHGTETVMALRAEEEFLRHAVAELDRLDPKPEEDAKLDISRRQMQSAARIQGDILRAHSALTIKGAEGVLTDALRWLEGAAGAADGRLDAPIEALSRTLEALGEAEYGVAGCLDALSFDPHELENIEERLFAIRALARKHEKTPDELPGFAGELRIKLARLDGSVGNLGALEKAVETARAGFDTQATALRQRRTEAAARLDKAMAAELAPLKMERAVFRTHVSEAPAGPDGIDAVLFQVATNPGAPAGALNKIASGGELSRFLLALKVCLTDQAQGITMIFDEIDRGVGGATADAVGRRLKSLAQDSQVLVVTHSPQVAALGGHHWRVQKKVEGDVTTSTVVALRNDDRVDELARMLAGDRVTSAARAAALALLDG